MVTPECTAKKNSAIKWFAAMHKINHKGITLLALDEPGLRTRGSFEQTLLGAIFSTTARMNGLGG
jgi:hypothetical protein